MKLFLKYFIGYTGVLLMALFTYKIKHPIVQLFNNLLVMGVAIFPLAVFIRNKERQLRLLKNKDFSKFWNAYDGLDIPLEERYYLFIKYKNNLSLLDKMVSVWVNMKTRGLLENDEKTIIKYIKKVSKYEK